MREKSLQIFELSKEIKKLYNKIYRLRNLPTNKKKYNYYINLINQLLEIEDMLYSRLTDQELEILKADIRYFIYKDTDETSFLYDELISHRMIERIETQEIRRECDPLYKKVIIDGVGVASPSSLFEDVDEDEDDDEFDYDDEDEYYSNVIDYNEEFQFKEDVYACYKSLGFSTDFIEEQLSVSAEQYVYVLYQTLRDSMDMQVFREISKADIDKNIIKNLKFRLAFIAPSFEKAFLKLEFEENLRNDFGEGIDMLECFNDNEFSTYAYNEYFEDEICDMLYGLSETEEYFDTLEIIFTRISLFLKALPDDYKNTYSKGILAFCKNSEWANPMIKELVEETVKLDTKVLIKK